MDYIDNFPVGAEVRFVMADVVRDVWIGDLGTVVESFAPHVGRNVRLAADGRIVNVSLVMLEEAPAEPALDESDYFERRELRTGADVLDSIARGVLDRGALVQLTRGRWASAVGRVIEVRPDASGDPFYVVALLGLPDVPLQFLHASAFALYPRATA